MILALAAVFLGVLSVAASQTSVFPDGLEAGPISESGVYNSLLSYIETCVEDGTCDDLIPEDARTTDHAGLVTLQDEHYDETTAKPYEIQSSPYFELCSKVHKKLEGIEALHPELEELKFKLVEKLNSYASGLSLECKEGESIVIKLLDMVIMLAQKLKAEFAHYSHKKPVPVEFPVEEIIAEDHEYGFVGSIRGIPGVHYPNYTEVPITSFSCSDKKYIPGFYADLETGCQVFHVCYEHRRESFLCPLGTIFNQPILACDYWYSSNCSQSPLYYDVNAKTGDVKVTDEVTHIDELITTIIEGEKPDISQIAVTPVGIEKEEFKDLLKFLPVKAKVFEFPEAPKVAVPIQKFVKPLPVSKPVVVRPKIVKPLLPLKTNVIAKSVAVPAAKIAVAAAASVPLIKAKVVSSAVVPVAKAKIASAAAIPVVKAKVVKAKVASAAVPVIKSKVVALPLAKTKVAAAASVPVLKAKAMPFVKVAVIKPQVVAASFKVKSAAAAVPLIKSTSAGIPLVKAKLAKAAISPLTKKALALGYMKLLKAKKLALLG